MIKRVAIIGGGPGGIVAAKECVAHGLQPTVFEKNASPGGVWNPDRGKVWQSMHTNLSRHHMGFSDFPWPEDTQDFPHNTDVYRYLMSYIDHFSLQDSFHYNQAIEQVSFENNTWNVRHNGQEDTFDAAILASGVFSKGSIPPFKGLSDFQGDTLHSQDYKESVTFTNKKTLVVGSSFSAYEIASDLAKRDVEVTHVFHRPSWILNRFVNDIPLDLASNNYMKLFILRENHFARNKRIEERFGNPGAVHPQLMVESGSNKPVPVVISDDYLSGVTSKKIQPARGTIDHFTANGFELTDGRHHACDSVVFCTGFDMTIPYLGNSILETCHFDAKDNFQPLILNKSTLHPAYPSLGFVGMYRGPYLPVMEMQARWIAGTFSNAIAPPSKEAHEKALEDEWNIRLQHPQPQFPRSDYMGFMMELAQEIGVVPTELVNGFANKNPMLPCDFRRHGPGCTPELAKETRDKALSCLYMS